MDKDFSDQSPYIPKGLPFTSIEVAMVRPQNGLHQKNFVISVGSELH
jgi:hypothetical protein